MHEDTETQENKPKKKTSSTPAGRLRELADAIEAAVKGGRCVDWDAVEGGRDVGKRDAIEQWFADQGIQEARSRFARLVQAYVKCRVNLDISEEEDVWFKDAVLGFQVQRVPILQPVPDAQNRAYDKSLTDFAWRLKYRAQEWEVRQREAAQKRRAEKTPGTKKRKNEEHPDSLKTWLQKERPVWVKERKKQGKGISWVSFVFSYRDTLDVLSTKNTWGNVSPESLRAAFDSSRPR